MRKTFVAIFLLVACLCLGSRLTQAQLLREVTPTGLEPLPGSKVWKPDAADIELTLPYHARIRPDTLVVGPDHPNGFRFLAVFRKEGVYLPVNFDDRFRGFDEYGDLQPGYFVEVATHRFSPEGEPELVIALGNGRTELAVNVLKYHAPASRQAAVRPENWTVEGSFLGQAQARIKGNAVELPAASPKAATLHTWTQGRFN